MILVIDNYDSFVFTVARYLEELGVQTKVVRNDVMAPDEIMRMRPDAVVLSPGPCGPREAGQSLAIVRELTGRLPMLGVCLGHQCIGEAFGGKVARAQEPMHGRASQISHDRSGLFRGLPDPFRAGRYHSLAVEMPAGVETPLMVTARSERGEIMALAHRHSPTFGVQFHPESVLTEHGHALLGNFLEIAAEWRRHAVA